MNEPHVRVLKLHNSRGDIVELNNHESLGYNPQGLGVSFNDTYSIIGTNYALNERTVNQSMISLNMVFGLDGSDPYKSYYRFAQFLNFPPYRLEYITKAGGYYRDVRVREMPKSEINTNGVIDETIVLEAEGLWYREVTNQEDLYVHAENGGKIYDKRAYAYTYERTKQNIEPDEIIFFNDSMYQDRNILSAFEISIHGMKAGYTGYPEMELYQDGVLQQSERVEYKPTFAEPLTISSFPFDQKVVKTVGKEEINLVDKLDLTKSNFIKIPQGESKLKLIGFENKDVTYRVRYEWVVV